jgi:hypothetical protein
MPERHRDAQIRLVALPVGAICVRAPVAPPPERKKPSPSRV